MEKFNFNRESFEKGKSDYDSFLREYMALQRKIREADLRGTIGEIKYWDQQKSEMHRKLLIEAKKIGKNQEDMENDIFAQEGNLLEYGIKAPLIKLPFIGSTFVYAEEKERIIPQNDGCSSQQLISPSGEEILVMRRPPWNAIDYNKKLEDVEMIQMRDEEIIEARKKLEEWRKGEYYAIIFSIHQEVNKIFLNSSDLGPILHKTRLKRARKLAQDFGLNLYEAQDTLGHYDYGPSCLYGVEVPKDRISEIAKAMYLNPEKYWLTDDELEDPFASPNFREEDPARALCRLESQKLENREWLFVADVALNEIENDILFYNYSTIKEIQNRLKKNDFSCEGLVGEKKRDFELLLKRVKRRTDILEQKKSYLNNFPQR